MRLVLFAGRALLGSLFIEAGQRVMRKPAMATAVSAPVLTALRSRVPIMPAHDELLIRANAVVHVVAGAGLALGRLPRLCALVLAGSLVPTTVAGHAYWQADGAAMRRQQKSHFEKNLAIFGGLLAIAAAPSTHRQHVPPVDAAPSGGPLAPRPRSAGRNG